MTGFAGNVPGAMLARLSGSPAWIAVVLASLIFAAPAGAQRPDAIVGVWLTEPGDKGGRAHVTVSREGAAFVGRISWLEEPEFPSGPDRGMPKVDVENPDEALRGRPLLGLAILSGMTWQGDGTWGGGTIYDPANGKTYSATMSLDGPADDTLDVRGFVGISLFGRTSVWRRVE